MIFRELTTTAGILGIIQSLLLLAWDVFFLFVCFQPGIFNAPWLEFYFLMVEEISYGVNGIVIVSTLLNFVWLISSIGSLLSNAYSGTTASGLRIWMAVTISIVFSDLCFTVFVTASTTVIFEDLFRKNKEFANGLNSTYSLIETSDEGNRPLGEFDDSVMYKGYVWLLVGVSRGFLITVIINVILIFVVFKRAREIRLGPKAKFQNLNQDNDTESNFYMMDLENENGELNNGFHVSSPPNMYAEPTPPVNQVNQYSEPSFNTFKTEQNLSLVPNRFKMSQRPVKVERRESERRSSARNYDLNIEAVPHATPFVITPGYSPSAPQLQVNRTPSKNQYSTPLPHIPDPDYDELPLRVAANYQGRQGYDNTAFNPMYETSWTIPPQPKTVEPHYIQPMPSQEPVNRNGRYSQPMGNYDDQKRY